MDGYVKAMCMKLAELALETEGIDINICDYRIGFYHYDYRNGKVKTIYYDNINFIETDAEQRIEKALDYVRNLGGNKDGR